MKYIKKFNFSYTNKKIFYPFNPNIKLSTNLVPDTTILLSSYNLINPRQISNNEILHIPNQNYFDYILSKFKLSSTTEIILLIDENLFEAVNIWFIFNVIYNLNIKFENLQEIQYESLIKLNLIESTFDNKNSLNIKNEGKKKLNKFESDFYQNNNTVCNYDTFLSIFAYFVKENFKVGDLKSILNKKVLVNSLLIITSNNDINESLMEKSKFDIYVDGDSSVLTEIIYIPVNYLIEIVNNDINKYDRNQILSFFDSFVNETDLIKSLTQTKINYDRNLYLIGSNTGDICFLFYLLKNSKGLKYSNLTTKLITINSSIETLLQSDLFQNICNKLAKPMISNIKKESTQRQKSKIEDYYVSDYDEDDDQTELVIQNINGYILH